MSIDGKLTEEQVDANRERVIGLLEGTGRSGVDELVSWLDKDTDYFTAPASTSPKKHGCYKGGLAQHSLNVYDLMKEKVDRFGLEVHDDEVVISTLLHDLCKVNQYVPNMVQKKGRGVAKGEMVQSEAKPYVIQDALPCGHSEKSMMLATRRMELSNTEIMLIRWHMGPYDAAWEREGQRAQKACPAITAMHYADNEASKYLD